jgi:hypothetical protein
MFVLVRNVGEPEPLAEPLAEAARRGRPPKTE